MHGTHNFQPRRRVNQSKDWTPKVKDRKWAKARKRNDGQKLVSVK